MADALSQMYLMTDLLVPDRNYFESVSGSSSMEHVNAAWPAAPTGATATSTGPSTTNNDNGMMQWTGSAAGASANNAQHHHHVPQSVNQGSQLPSLPRTAQYTAMNQGNNGSGHMQYNSGYVTEKSQANGGATYLVHGNSPHPGEMRNFNDPGNMEKAYLIQQNRIPSDYPVNHSGVHHPRMLMSNGQPMNGGYGQPQFYPDLSPMENPPYPGSNPAVRLPSNGPISNQRMRPYMLPANTGNRKQASAAAAAAQNEPQMYVRYPQYARAYQQQVVPVRSASTATGGPVRSGSQFPFSDGATVNAPSAGQQLHPQHNSSSNNSQSNSYPPPNGMMTPMYSQQMQATGPMRYGGPVDVYPGHGRNGELVAGPFTVMNNEGPGMGQPLQIQQIPNPNMRIPPFIQPCDDEPRMTLAVSQEPIIHPFKLEHNLQVSKHEFTLRPDTYEALRTNPDLQLELKCYQHADRRTNWPEAVAITINNTPIAIPRTTAPGVPRSPYHRDPALHVKQLCLPPGKKNVVIISANACCCSHQFLLHIVHRPTIRSLFQKIIKTGSLPVNRSIEKVKQLLLGPNRIYLPPALVSNSGELIVDVTCVFSRRRMVVPARGSKCHHFACFDLNNYLYKNSELDCFACPLCSEPVPPDQIEVDEFLWTILKQLPPSEPGCLDVDEILLDSNAQWKPSRSSVRLSERISSKYHPISPAGHVGLPHWESSPSHHFPQELPRSLSTGRNTPRGGPNSVGHPLSLCSMTSDYGSPASMSAIVPVSPSAKSFPGSVASCPQESPAASSSMSHGARTPVPQSVQYSGVGSFPSTPKTPGGSQSHSAPSALDTFFDAFAGDGDTDSAALQLLSDMESADFFSLLDGPLLDGPSSTTTFPNSTGNASDSGISNVSYLTPRHSPADESLVKGDSAESQNNGVT